MCLVIKMGWLFQFQDPTSKILKINRFVAFN